MQAVLYVLSGGVGVVLAIHLAMNGKVGVLIANPRVGNAIFWIVGAVAAVLIGLTGLTGGNSSLHRLSSVPAYLYLAGAIGAVLVFVIAWLIPRIGAGPAMVTMLTGQVICGLIISQYGWLGSPVQPMNGWNALGVLLLFGGAILTVVGH